MDTHAEWKSLVKAMRGQEELVKSELSKLDQSVRDDVVVEVLLRAIYEEGAAVDTIESLVEERLSSGGPSMGSTVAMDQYWRQAQRVIHLQTALLRELLHVGERMKQVRAMEPEGLAKLYTSSEDARTLREEIVHKARQAKAERRGE